jgi:hypothetical protein
MTTKTTQAVGSPQGVVRRQVVRSRRQPSRSGGLVQLVLFPNTIGQETAHCRQCGRYYRKGEEPDPCIGWLADVDSCCCGHGNPEQAYVDPAGSWAEAAAAGSDWGRRWQILDRHRLRGHAGLEFLAARGCGPTQALELKGPASKAPTAARAL